MLNIKLYNTFSHQKELFKPLNPKEVSLYTCGPTVYQSPTIGNWRTYVFEDTLKRALEYFGFPVRHVINITDVGHLTSDADSGEDKLEKAAKKEKLTAWEIAKKYEREFKRDLKNLNILPPAKFTRATDYIKEQIDLIKTLEQKGFTYRASDGIYYDTAKFANYGQLARLKTEGLKEGARVEKNEEKRNPTDFALWKFSPTGAKRDMEWDSPWGVGFPGWHLECSAMALKELGPTIDLHCGGVDLQPIHHTNEIAQAEAATGKSPFVRYWLHGEFLLIDGSRMGKSLGNAYTLKDVENKGFDPLDLRFFYFSAHYRKKLNFSWSGLIASRTSLKRIRRDIRWLQSHQEGAQPEKERFSDRAKEIFQVFDQAILDDLNLPRALAALNTIVDSNDLQADRSVKMVGERLVGDQGRYLSAAERIAIIGEMDKILGLELIADYDLTIPEEVLQIQKERDLARKQGDWQRSDQLRKELEKQGFAVRDEKSASKLIKRN